MRTVRFQLAPADNRDSLALALMFAEAGRRPGKELGIGRDQNSPLAVGMLSLGVLLPFGIGVVPDRAIALLTDAAGGGPAKHVLFVNGSARDVVETRTANVEAFLHERGITVAPDDRLSSPLDAPLRDGETLEYRAAVAVTIDVDGTSRTLRTAAATVGEVLATSGMRAGPHDTVSPDPKTPVEAGTVIRYSRATSWLEHIRTAILAPIQRKYDIALGKGRQRVIDPGRTGTKEAIVEVLQPERGVAPQRVFLTEHILRFPRAKVIAEGVGDDYSLAGLARRGIAGTRRLADAALRMVATAYTAGCSGCSGTTKMGQTAGHGIVAVDPRYIPLGTHLYIPGYGHALAGDTGGAIRGNRIDLGFNSQRDAMVFGRRPIVVYVFK
jgi:3D (Asp-Asp-Asp) domain-containing protein